MTKVLVLGATGLVGNAIVNELKQEYMLYTTYCNNEPFEKDNSYRIDIDEINDIVTLINDIKPHIVISCLRGDFEKQLVFHTVVAQQLKRYNGKLYYCSTTNVFDYSFDKVYTEYDKPKAKSEYGKFKIKCEDALIDILGEDVCILRLPQVMSTNGGRLKQMKTDLDENIKMKVYPNLMFNTVTDIIIAKKVSYIISNNLKGVFHITSSDTIDHKTFYSELAKRLGYKDINFDEDENVKGYFALQSVRENEYKPRIEITNMQVIEYLGREFHK